LGLKGKKSFYNSSRKKRKTKREKKNLGKKRKKRVLGFIIHEKIITKRTRTCSVDDPCSPPVYKTK
jgi:hypothetical protein